MENYHEGPEPSRNQPTPIAPDQPPAIEVVFTEHRHPCHTYFSLCEEYLNSLGFPDRLRAKRFDFCYCVACLTRMDQNNPSTGRRNKRTSSTANQWAQFGLFTFQYARQWPGCYYGIRRPENILAILENKEFDIIGNQVFTSPSIHYAAHKEFSTKGPFRANNGTGYFARIVLKCKQQPGRYAQERAKYMVKKLPDPDELVHWSSDVNSIVPYAIMIRLTLPKTVDA